ncbi:Dynamin:ATP/GTP-binding site motif A (P-loop):Cobalamin synthesis protein/P47K [Fulvimarina pelagi HTCC2506]|uniref:Dynamin:ATP/GTP-binding site motif A (P-loop):Cobalamin synthesis protein/P47K n=2 Tax=Fulvimarina pelagi TaxID=217511 RepID=Q0G0G8_9HYPH|nr:cobalamin biosynthesis protein CobW [Fulvimarina pelagi]EAU40625.1 Dynamin:ATP/GTP-binding site motif A (P-loop):Cobalamin synthesis protein/P47K [Fulvimarina pelagi HTCC2506]BAT31170.1 cobW protein [Fulvimarina pelagi]
MSKIPATVITGFLGAGKTTLIRNMLQDAGGRKIALIINEFGDLGVDGNILTGCGIETCTEDDVVELTNGCICCTVADDFIPTMTRLLAREDKPDHIVIETSGLALPQPLVAAFNWPEVKTNVTVDGVVTVVDAAAVADGRFADDEAKVAALRAADESLDHDNPLEELFEDQLRAADLVVLNKADLIDREVLEKVRSEIAGKTERTVRTVASEHGKLPTDVLLGIEAGTENLILDRKAHHEMEHESGESHEHDHDEFESFVVDAGSLADRDGFEAALPGLIARHDILRLKGFADVPGKKMRLVIQAVGKRLETYFDRPWKADETRETRLVVIGLHHDLDAAARDEITNELNAIVSGEARQAAE